MPHRVPVQQQTIFEEVKNQPGDVFRAAADVRAAARNG
jgi:hypothetical protein